MSALHMGDVGTKAGWLSPEEVAERAPGVTPQNLAEMRKKRIGPPYYKPTPRTVLYLDTEIDAWIEAGRVQPRGAES